MDSASFYGMGDSLPLDNSEVYQNMHDLYAVSPVQQLDTMMMPSVGVPAVAASGSVAVAIAVVASATSVGVGMS